MYKSIFTYFILLGVDSLSHRPSFTTLPSVMENGSSPLSGITSSSDPQTSRITKPTGAIPRIPRTRVLIETSLSESNSYSSVNLSDPRSESEISPDNVPTGLANDNFRDPNEIVTANESSSPVIRERGGRWAENVNEDQSHPYENDPLVDYLSSTVSPRREVGISYESKNDSSQSCFSCLKCASCADGLEPKALSRLAERIKHGNSSWKCQNSRKLSPFPFMATLVVNVLVSLFALIYYSVTFL